MSTRSTMRQMFPRTASRGFTLMEMLISMSITALLLVAMGGAFTAAASSVETNDQFFRSMQQARSAQDMIMTLIRRCQGVTAANSSGITFNAANASGNADFNGDSLTIAYNAAGPYAGDITLTDNTANTTTVMAANVSTATFTSTNGTDMNSNPVSFAVIGLSMTIRIDNNQVTMSNSAAPRVYNASLFK